MQPEFDAAELLKAVDLARGWLRRVTGEFSAFVFGKECGFENATLRDQVLGEFVRQGMIEPTGRQHNRFIRVDCDCQELNWREAEDKPYPMVLPLGLNNLCMISPGNIIVCAGETNAGKTAFALDVAHKNLAVNGGEHGEVFYFNSEMSAAEMKGRLLNKARVETWEGLRAFSRTRDFHQVVRPGALNIIDYLEVLGDFWEVGTAISRIHEVLGSGVALICLQKRTGVDFGRGGEFSLEKARLALNLAYDKPTKIRTCKITKCKSPVGLSHPDGKELDYTMPNGWTFEVVRDWQYVSKEDRSNRQKADRFEAQREEWSRKKQQARADVPI